MIEHNISNNYLKKVIVEINNHEDISDDLLFKFSNELMVSNLIIPGFIEDDEINFEVVSSSDGLVNVIPVFSDEVEFKSYYGNDDEYSLIANEIDFYIDLINENNFNGLLINPGSDDFLVEKNTLLELPIILKKEINDCPVVYDKYELYKISKEIANDSLVEFIKNNNDSLEELMYELSQSNLLNLLICENNSEDKNIINLDDIDEYAVCTTEGDNQFGILFTSKDIMDEVIDNTEYNFYYQLTLLDDFIEFILKNDLDGLIINPGLNDYIISREYLFEAYGGLSYNNPKFLNSIKYAFIF